MPLLWKNVQLFNPSLIMPYTLKYPGTVERVWPYITEIRLSVSCENVEFNRTKLNRLCKYASKCLHVLTAAKHVKSLHLYLGHFSKTDRHSSEFGGKLKAINSFIRRTIKYVSTISNLDEFGWHPEREMVLSRAGRAVEGKVTELQLRHLGCGDWIDDLLNYKRLTSIKLYYSRSQEESDEFNRKFWTTIAELDECGKTLDIDVPIPFGWNIQFRNITGLRMMVWYFSGAVCWMDTVMAIFTCMPELKALSVKSCFYEIDAQQLALLAEISNVACTKLEDLYIGGYAPRGLFLALGAQCPGLKFCRFNLQNMSDDDLAALSRCQHMRTFDIRTPNAITSDGLQYLTNLPQLTELQLHYSFGQCIHTQLLLDFARFCPSLDIIRITNYNETRTMNDPPGPLETTDVFNLFLAGAELFAFFEPQHRTASEWTPAGLDGYHIHIDWLRRDKLSQVCTDVHASYINR
jgi:hypothetical protein